MIGFPSSINRRQVYTWSQLASKTPPRRDSDAMLISFIVRTTAEPSPAGSVNVYHVMSRDQNEKTTGLRHSEICEHSQVIEFVGDWISGKLRADQQSGNAPSA